MNEYAVRLHDGRIINTFAFSRADIPTTLEDEGISRGDIAGIRLLAKRSEAARTNRGQPYAELREAA